MAGHAGYLSLLEEMRHLHVQKAADYGRGQDPLANCRGSAEFGIPPWVGTMVRAMDKVHRIKSFVANGSLKNESVEDSLKDLAAYALIALVLFREQQPGGPVCKSQVQADEIGRAWGRTVAGSAPTPAPPGRRKRVYIAGPISKGDLAGNVNQATEAFVRLAKAGLAPLCPQWSVYAKPCKLSVAVPDGVYAIGTRDGNDEMGHADWLAVDLAWVTTADAVLRLPGESAGADEETAYAVASGISVFTDIETLLQWAESK